MRKKNHELFRVIADAHLVVPAQTQKTPIPFLSKLLRLTILREDEPERVAFPKGATHTMNIFLLLITFQARNGPPNSLRQALSGSWVGTLEYRDYSDNSRVKLGTLLRVYEASADGRLVFRYVYDDGPKKVVQDEDRVEVNEANKTYIVFSSDGKSTDPYSVSGLESLSKAGFGTLGLTGKAIENGILVDVREKFTIRSGNLDILRESKIPGGPWLFRHEFIFHRVEPPHRK